MSDIPDGYDDYTVSDVRAHVQTVRDAATLKALHDHEQANKNRVTALEAIDDRLADFESAVGTDPADPEPDQSADPDPADAAAEPLPDDAEMAPGSPGDDHLQKTIDGTPVEPARASPGEPVQPHTGADNTERVFVRNAKMYGQHVAGQSFEPGEIKEVVLTDAVRRELEHGGSLQFVKPAPHKTVDEV